MPFAVSMMTGKAAVRASRRHSPSKARPEVSGSIQSSKTSCGNTVEISLRASAASLARLVVKPAPCIVKRNNSAMLGSSSTNNICNWSFDMRCYILTCSWFAAWAGRPSRPPAFSDRYFISNPLGHRLRRLRLLRLHHHPDQRFRAGRADQDATAIAQRLFDFVFFSLHAGIGLPIKADRNLDVDQHLRIHANIRRHLGQTLTGTLERRQHLQCRHDAVAGGVFVETQQVA